MDYGSGCRVSGLSWCTNTGGRVRTVSTLRLPEEGEIGVATLSVSNLVLMIQGFAFTLPDAGFRVQVGARTQDVESGPSRLSGFQRKVKSGLPHFRFPA